MQTAVISSGSTHPFFLHQFSPLQESLWATGNRFLCLAPESSGLSSNFSWRARTSQNDRTRFWAKTWRLAAMFGPSAKAWQQRHELKFVVFCPNKQQFFKAFMCLNQCYLRSRSGLTSPSSMAFCRSSLRLLFSCCRASLARLRRRIVSFSAFILTEFSEPDLWKIERPSIFIHSKKIVSQIDSHDTVKAFYVILLFKIEDLCYEICWMY